MHRHLWVIVEREATAESFALPGSSLSALVAKMFAFHTVEAYLNFVGEKLAPEIWLNERNYFRMEPYRGFDGKFRKVMELTALPWIPNERPLKTILELKFLRDLIAHGKSERRAGEVLRPSDTDLKLPDTKLSELIAQGRLPMVLSDVEELLNQIHSCVNEKISDDPWLGGEALRGPLTYSAAQTLEE